MPEFKAAVDEIVKKLKDRLLLLAEADKDELDV